MDKKKQPTPRQELEKLQKSGFNPVRADNIPSSAKTVQNRVFLNSSSQELKNPDFTVSINDSDTGNSFGNEHISVKRNNLNLVKNSVYENKNTKSKKNKKKNSDTDTADASGGQFVRKSDSFTRTASGYKPRKSSVKYAGRYPQGNGILRILTRIIVSFATLILFVSLSAYMVLFSVAHGQSETARNTLVLNAQESKTFSWIPNLVLSDKTIDSILHQSLKKSTTETELSVYTDETDNESVDGENQPSDIFASSTDGVLLETLDTDNYKAYILLIKDPSLVYVASSGNFTNEKSGITVFDCAEKNQCLCAISGGQSADDGDSVPVGLTYSQSSCTWKDKNTENTFVGFDVNNKMIVSEGMTEEKAAELKIRDGVSFGINNVLIESTDKTVKINHYNNNTATGKRAAIGQTADGTVIFIVTDGLSQGHRGATVNDIVNLMVKYKAITAAMIGGSSPSMYYRSFLSKCQVDASEINEYSKKGLVNAERDYELTKFPTYFVVRGN